MSKSSSNCNWRYTNDMDKIEERYCKNCGYYSNCPYIPRNLTHKCPDLDGWLSGYYAAQEDLRKELFQLGLSSNPMDYVNWVGNKLKELEEQ